MKVPKKNISKVLYDVKPDPSFEVKNPPRYVKENLERVARPLIARTDGSAKIKVGDIDSEVLKPVKLREERVSYVLGQERVSKPRIHIPVRRKIKTAHIFAVVAFAIIVIYGVGLYGSKDTVLSSFYKIQSNVMSSAGHFKNLKTGDAYESLQTADGELKNIKKEFSRYGLASAGEWFGFIFPTIKNVNTALKDLENFFGSALDLSLKIEELKKSGFQYFLNGDGEKFVLLLSGIEHDLRSAVNMGSELANISTEIKKSPFAKKLEIPEIGGDLAVFTDAYAASDFMSSLIGLLKEESGSHLLILFQNPSEIRPSGGFLGSYADISIQNGAMAGMDVRDIYDPDGWLNLKLVPPKPLQAQTVDWEARDANWFFDFSLSAGKVSQLLEASKFYEERGTKFAGVVGVNTDVLKSLIQITGPIELPEYSLVLDEENFLEELQNEVEVGRNKAQNKPKKILADMTPKLLAALENLNEENKAALFDVLKAHLDNKDIQIYFADLKMQAFIDKYNLGGDIYALPQGYFGDYLAVVNANVAGGKTDIYTKQNIVLNSKIDSAGTLTNELKVTRTHEGGRTKYSWYNVTNKIFSRILTPKGAKLTADIGGFTERVINPTINYSKSAYSEDGDVVLLEAQKEEGGKNVFDAWIYTKPGSSKTLTLNYVNSLQMKPKSGLVYKFVFDKQSGVNSGFKYVIEAPPGFIWKEADSAVFEYIAENVPWRIELNLTLEEI